LAEAEKIKKLVSRIVALLCMVALVAFALANWQTVLVSFDPVTPDNPWLALNVPLLLAMFAAILIGLVAGWLAAWINDGKVRRAARDARAELKHLQTQAPSPPAVIR
jgi:uncharacterized integral membrane protein